MIVVTGATGKLGTLVVHALLKNTPAAQIVAAVRTPAKAAALAARGVQVREADYARPETLAAAFAGASKVLLISSNEVGKRFEQHQAVIDAAKAAKVSFLAYTSLLHADTTPMLLAEEHKATEEYLIASGLSYSLLRNGWYLENHTENLAPALQHGVILGAAGEGRFASAARADYAEAAAHVLTTDGHSDSIYELAGDTSFTLTELAASVSSISGKTIRYQNLPQQEYATALAGFGLPPAFADILADSDAQAAHGALDDTGKALSRLTGHSTVTLLESIKHALKA